MAKDSTLINPYISVAYKNPFTSARDIDQRKKNVGGNFIYDLFVSEFGDKLSLPNGVYELRLNDQGYCFIYDSQDKWTGYTLIFTIDGLNPTKPTKLIFLDGIYSFKISKKQKGKFGYAFTLIDNIYPKYSPNSPSNVTAKATVVDANTNKPVKAKVN